MKKLFFRFIFEQYIVYKFIKFVLILKKADLTTGVELDAALNNNREETNEFPVDYFDKTENSDDDFDFEYEYTSVINDDLNRILQAYDGLTSAELFLMQHQYHQLILRKDSISSVSNKNADEEKESLKAAALNESQNQQINLDQYSAKKESKREDANRNTVDSEDKSPERLEEMESKNKEKKRKAKDSAERSAEMYNIFKRMMVKKKYVLSTIKFEKEFGYNFRRLNKLANPKQIKQSASANSMLKSRPLTASLFANSVSSEIKLNRPRTATLIQQSIETSNDNNNNNEQINQASSATDPDFYEPFRLSPSLMNQEWPYEVEFDKPTIRLNKRTVSAKGNKNPNKCYTCKKLPIVSINVTSECQQTATNSASATSANAQAENKSQKKQNGKVKANLSGDLSNQNYNISNLCIVRQDTSIGVYKKVTNLI